MKIRQTMGRAASVGAAATIALGLFSIGAADADTFVPLPGADLTKTLSDGTVVHVWIDAESANINPSMGSTPLHRNAWVSGTAHVELSGTNGDVGGSIFPGYTVGCQVNISGGGVTGGTTGSLDWSGDSVRPNVGGNTGGNLTLGPGQAKSFYVLDLEEADDFGNQVHRTRNKFGSNSGSVAWADETIGLSGCAGYAQARSFVSVQVVTSNITSWVTLWGQPFSIG
ncbi:MspA family porin [Nocardia sp. NPDC047038]|uniref:MspA family porin n=1 Tax=Nocardia sp. NPDC047038 TaxID=3154338 RepID=UPI0033C1DE09